MKKLLDSPYVSWSAILSGGSQFLGLVFLILFYTLEAPQILESGQPDTPPLFGILNDATFIFVALFMIPPALALYKLLQLKTPTLARVALVIGLLGLLAGAIVQLLYVTRVISLVQQGQWLPLSVGLIGVWMTMVNLLGRRGGILSGGLGWLGMITGVCMSLLPVTYFAGGGSEVINDPSASLSNPLLIAGFVLSLIGYAILFPIWAIWLGRSFLLRKVTLPN